MPGASSVTVTRCSRWLTELAVPVSAAPPPGFMESALPACATAAVSLARSAARSPPQPAANVPSSTATTLGRLCMEHLRCDGASLKRTPPERVMTPLPPYPLPLYLSPISSITASFGLRDKNQHDEKILA